MKTLRAVNTIVMCVEPGKAGDKAKGIAPIRPKLVTILPKTRFKAQSEQQEDELLSQGAAVIAEDLKADPVIDPTADTKPKTPAKSKAKAAEKPAEAEKPDAPEAGEGEGDDDGEDDLV